jgi:hypothetical protein
MKRLVLAATVFAAFVFLSGCAASRPVAKSKEPPPLSVRIPVVDASTMNIESDPSIAYPIANPQLPLSLADESRGRWLNMFEVNYTPAKPPVPPLPDDEEEP